MRPMLRPQKFTAVLAEKTPVTKDVTYFKFNCPEDFTYYPGQFVMIEVPQEDKPVQRAYSISSAPQPGEFELCVKILSDGLATQYLNGLNIGDEMQCKGPFGMCTIDPDTNNKLIMVATGTGLAPIKSIVDDILNRGDKRSVHILFGVRHEEDMFSQEYFGNIAAENPQIEFELTLSQPTENWAGLTGRVTEHLEQFDFSAPEQELYICGSGAMIKSVRDYALEQGMDKKHIHVENFG